MVGLNAKQPKTVAAAASAVNEALAYVSYYSNVNITHQVLQSFRCQSRSSGTNIQGPSQNLRPL